MIRNLLLLTAFFLVATSPLSIPVFVIPAATRELIFLYGLTPIYIYLLVIIVEGRSTKEENDGRG